MSLLQQPIEKKLSRLLGRKVTFGLLKISPLGGRLEAEDMIVEGDDANEPMLSVRRITAQVSLAKALGGQFDLKSLVIEGPQIFISRHADGSFNLPQRPARFAPPNEEDSKPWQFEAQSIRIEAGQIRFRDGSYVASADQISGDFKYQGSKIDLSLSIPKLGRRDIPVEFGPLDLTGQIDLPGSFVDLPQAPVRLDLKFPAGLSLTVDSPNPSLGRAAIALEGKLDAAQWLSAMPPGISVPPILTATKFNAPVAIALQTEITAPIAQWFPPPSRVGPKRKL